VKHTLAQEGVLCKPILEKNANKEPSSTIPLDDPTLLFANAGMNQV
jgi:hypothetical protein